MQKHIAIPFLLIGLFVFSFAKAQVKIGDNPQVIDPSSILELESSDKVLVITRVDSLQMTTIVPNRGALVYNTTADCVFYYDGAQWINMCGDEDEEESLTANPIVNDISTIVITPTATGNNLEVAPNSINSEQIINGGINGIDIQDGSIGPGKLQNNSVTQDKLSENSVGAFALDNDNVDLGDFSNNAGFITSAAIISGDANNAITPGGDNGAFYDDSGLQTAIGTNTTAIATNTAAVVANTAAIAADDDQSATNEIQDLSLTGNVLSLSLSAGTVTLPTADGSDTNINAGNNITISGNGTIATPYVINAADEVDGLITNELQDLNYDPATNVLTITNSATAGNQVNLSALETLAQINSTATVTVAGDGSIATPYELTAVGGGNQNLSQVLTEGNDANAIGITNLTTDGSDATAAATVGFVNAAVTAGGALTDGSILVGGAGDVAQQLTVNGDALLDNTGLLTIQDGTINSDKILDATIALADLNANGATTNGEIMQWDTAANAGAGGWVIANNSGGHSGTPNSIFFAAADGTPTEGITPSGDQGLIWDQSKRLGFGAMGIGLDGFTHSDNAKVHIMEGGGAALSFPLQIQKRSNANGRGAAILFSVDGSNVHGKGALVYERTGAFAVGDFHFLQNTNNTNTSLPTLTDKAFTIKNNGDIQLYGNLIARNGAGTNGDVLTRNAAGETVWGAGGSAGTVTTDTTLSGDGAGVGTALGIADDGVTEVKILDGSVTTNKLADNGVTITKIQEGSDGDILTTDSFGEVVWAAPAAGAVQTVPTSISGNGLVGSELFVAPNAITTGEIINETILSEDILDGTIANGDLATNSVETTNIVDDNVTPDKIEASATAGQVLTTVGTDVVWAAPSAGAVQTVPTSLSGNGLVGSELFVAPNAIATGEILNETILSEDILDGTIANGDLATNSVETTNIVDDNVTPDKIEASATAGQVLTTVGTDVVWAAPTSLEVSLSTFSGDGTFGSELDINDSGIVTDMLEENAVTPAKIEASATAGQVLTTVGTDVVWAAPSAGAVQTVPTSISGNGLVGSELFVAPNAIATGEILNETILSEDILDGAISNSDMATNSVATTNILDDNVTPSKIEASATAGQVLTTVGTDVVWAAPAGEVSGITGSIFFADTDGSVTENNTELFWDNVNDRLGVGVPNPTNTIHTNGSVRVQQGFDGNNGTAGEPTYSFNSDTNTGMYKDGLADYLRFATGGIETMTIDPSQNIGIGYQNPAANRKLHVNGNVQFDGEVWGGTTLTLIQPDYVFQKYFLGTSELNADYNFESLEEIEAFVKQYHHLPGIKSASTVKKEGIWNLSESNLQNLEKIEELYLHTINQEKEINKLKSEKETLSKELQTIKKDLEEIKSLLKK